MELKDFELEAILKQALSDDTEVPSELNEKLMKKISAKRKKSHSPTAVMKYAAAAIVVAIGIGALTNGGYFSDKKGNETNKIASTDKNDDTSRKNDNPDNSPKPTDVVTDDNTVTDKKADLQIAKEEKSTTFEVEKAKNKSEKGSTAIATKKTKNSGSVTENSITEQRTKEYIIFKQSDKKDEKTDSPAEYNEVKPMVTEETTKNNKSYKYLEIAASNIGNALESLNIIANDSIDEYYTAKDSANIMLFSIASAEPICDMGSNALVEDSSKEENTSFTSENSVRSLKSMRDDSAKNADDNTDDKPDVTASYEVMSDTDNYYSVRVDAVADVGFPDEYSAYYTIDKNKDSIVALDDIYSDVPEYKQKLYDDICSQMNQRMKEDKNIEYYIGEGGFESITGNEDFYLNNLQEVVITYRDGTVAPYGQGKSEFNVGKTDELNNK